MIAKYVENNTKPACLPIRKQLARPSMKSARNIAGESRQMAGHDAAAAVANERVNGRQAESGANSAELGALAALER